MIEDSRTKVVGEHARVNESPIRSEYSLAIGLWQAHVTPAFLGLSVILMDWRYIAVAILFCAVALWSADIRFIYSRDWILRRSIQGNGVVQTIGMSLALSLERKWPWVVGMIVAMLLGLLTSIGTKEIAAKYNIPEMH